MSFIHKSEGTGQQIRRQTAHAQIPAGNREEREMLEILYENASQPVRKRADALRLPKITVLK